MRSTVQSCRLLCTGARRLRNGEVRIVTRSRISAYRLQMQARDLESQRRLGGILRQQRQHGIPDLDILERDFGARTFRRLGQFGRSSLGGMLISMPSMETKLTDFFGATSTSRSTVKNNFLIANIGGRLRSPPNRIVMSWPSTATIAPRPCRSRIWMVDIFGRLMCRAPISTSLWKRSCRYLMACARSCGFKSLGDHRSREIGAHHYHYDETRDPARMYFVRLLTS